MQLLLGRSMVLGPDSLVFKFWFTTFCVFVFYHYVTNQHHLNSLKQHLCFISQFLWARSPGTAELGALLRVSRGCSQGVSWAEVPSGA